MYKLHQGSESVNIDFSGFPHSCKWTSKKYKADREPNAPKSNTVRTETTQEQEKLEPVLTQDLITRTHCVWKQRAGDLKKKSDIQNQKEGGTRGGS